MFDQIADTFSDLEVQNSLLEVLKSINPSIAELFSIQLTQAKIISGKIYAKGFNYYGLLNASMMKGDAVENIAASCLADFMKRTYSDFN